MNPISISVTETHGIDRVDEPVRIGVPIKKGELFDAQRLSVIVSDTGAGVPFQARDLAKWHDQSLKWVLIEFAVSASGNTSQEYLVSVSTTKSHTENPFIVSESSSELLIDRGDSKISVNKQNLAIVQSQAETADGSISCSLTARDQNDSNYEVTVTDAGISDDSGPFRQTIYASGQLHNGAGDTLARIHCKTHVYAVGNSVDVEVCMHNAGAAKHVDGLWDLGDPGSVFFNELSATVCMGDFDRAAIKLQQDADWSNYENPKQISVYQDSSGGENWQSRAHLNYLGQVKNTFKGFRLSADGEQIASGARAEPVVSVTNSQRRVTAHMEHFWQNFPSAIEVNPNALVLKLFPSEYADSFELQAGERKTQRFSLSFDSDANALNGRTKPLLAKVDPEYLRSTRVIPNMISKSSNQDLDDLLLQGLDGEANFFAKRETADEYGWRNFGEVYADHESLYIDKPTENIHISHYNNQYDAIYGYFLQYALGDRPEWYELMDDLAKHVTDIDIYHTDGDRVEYNNGLFWHTNHYTPADTASHRTHSNHAFSERQRDASYGGGPSPEHCYTTGLLYHHFLTGSPESRAAVLQLADWMIGAHDGSPGLLAKLHSIKKTEVELFKELIRKENPLPYKYQFNRGTGNYISTLLDAHALTHDVQLVNKIEKIIRETLHPNDEIAHRYLDDPEASWSYVVLLNSIAKYLLMKEESSRYDNAYFYARESFLKYTEWMLANEQPYLSNPDVLEFVNHTWAAQEIRRSNLMIYAAQYDVDKRDQYIQKARLFLDAVTQTLQGSEERGLSRIQVILLQNYGVQGLLESNLETKVSVPAKSLYFGDAPKVTLFGLGVSAIRKVLSGIRHFSLSKEKMWLRTRTHQHLPNKL